MAVLLMLAGLGLVCVAVVWFMIIAPNKKRKEQWSELAVPAAKSMGAEEAPGRYGFQGLRKDTPEGPIGIFVSAGLVTEANLINRRAYMSNGSAYYANIVFQHDGLPRFEVTASGFVTEKFKNGEVGEFGNFFNVIADDAAAFNELWTQEAREIMRRSGLEWSVLSAGNQIQAVREGVPESADEMTDILRVVEILSARATARPVQAAA